VSEKIRLGDREVEFDEISNETVPENANPLDPSPAGNRPVRAARASAPRQSSAPIQPAVTAQELDRAEVTARVRLHQSGADLGEQIAIFRAADSVQISGVLDTAIRREQIVSALAGVPHLQVNLSSPENLPVDGLTAALLTPPASAISEPPLMAKWLESHYPDLGGRRLYIDQIVKSSRECLRRAYALQNLGERYPMPEDPAIKAIVHDHVVAMQQNWQALRNTIASVVDIDGAAVRPVSSGDPHDPSADDLLSAMKAVDSSLVALFVGRENAAGQVGSQTAVPNLDTDAARLREQSRLVTIALSRISQKH
jgi:hypothetical protein